MRDPKQVVIPQHTLEQAVEVALREDWNLRRQITKARPDDEITVHLSWTLGGIDLELARRVYARVQQAEAEEAARK